MSTILQLAPQNVWKHFYSLTQIPRPSRHPASPHGHGAAKEQ